MQKMIVIALCLVANFTFGYKIGPRSTTDSLVISTWRAKNEALAEEGRVIAVEIQKIQSPTEGQGQFFFGNSV